MSTIRESILNAWSGAWGSGDSAAFEQLLAPGYVRISKSGSQDYASLKKTIKAIHTAFPDLTARILHFVEDEATAAIHWQSTGTHRGTFMEAPASGQTITVTGASFLRLDTGAIAEEWVVCDPRELLSAIGIRYPGPDAEQAHCRPLLGAGGPRSPQRRREVGQGPQT